MKKPRYMILAFAAALALAAPGTALADHLTGSSNWVVTYDKDGKMTDTFTEMKQEYVDQIRNLQPGDDITFTVVNKHENSSAADWYVSNDVITSLEDSRASAEGSAYEYLLVYDGANEDRTLYDSQNVGGYEEDKNGNVTGGKQGLNEATDAMDEYIFLENMKKGDEGKLTLKVTLDGETEGNAYFDTMAQLKVRYAVEPTTETKNPDNPTNPPTNTTVVRRNIVRTGDETRLFPFYVAMFVSGLLLLALAIDSVRQRRKAKARQEVTR